MKRKIIVSTIAVFCICLLSIGSGADDQPQIAKEYHPPGTKGGPMVFVPEGEFIMGCYGKTFRKCNEDRYKEVPYHKVFLDAYYIDKYEVTVARYAECVQDGGCKTPGYFPEEKKWDEPGTENLPVRFVDWQEAKTYCEWAGKRLPTEAEWEKAARGTDGANYPWGNRAPTCAYAVMYVLKRKKPACGAKDEHAPWPVGSKPKGVGPYGAMDMAGNVFEWTADWWDREYYKNSPYKNPPGPAAEPTQYSRNKRGLRVSRGGSYKEHPDLLLSFSRWILFPEKYYEDVGIRCAL